MSTKVKPNAPESSSKGKAVVSVTKKKTEGSTKPTVDSKQKSVSTVTKSEVPTWKFWAFCDSDLLYGGFMLVCFSVGCFGLPSLWIALIVSGICVFWGCGFVNCFACFNGLGALGLWISELGILGFFFWSGNFWVSEFVTKYFSFWISCFQVKWVIWTCEFLNSLLIFNALDSLVLSP